MHGKTKKLLSILIITALLLMNGSWALASGYPQERSALKAANLSPEGSFAVPQRDKSQIPGARKKLSTDLLSLVDEVYSPSGQTGPELRLQMEGIGQFRQAPFTRGISEAGDGQVYVYVYLKPSARTNVVDPYVNVQSRDENKNYVVGWVDVSDLDSLADMNEVRSVRTVVPPVVRTGSVNSEGDGILNADAVRLLGVDGTGVKVGIISNGVESISDSVYSGDLPSDVTVLSAGSGDEGTAMLEIVHDLAPGAQLYFHNCGSNTADFNDAVDQLAASGCNIICDDIGWITEPFFEDGVVAGHIASVIAGHDVLYVSAAGNDAVSHYQGLFTPYGSSLDHDFSDGTDPSNPNLYVNIPAGETVYVILQWDDRWGSSGNDYDLYLYNNDGILAGSIDTQDGSGDPIEVIAFKNTGADTDAAIAVSKHSGLYKNLEVYVYGGFCYADNTNPWDSIFGHPAIPGVIAVGAVNYSDPADIAYYSSRGRATLYDGTTRAKPEVCGVDGVAVTGAGGFGQNDGGTMRFYGTSAAAPHVAAVAALAMEKNPALTASEVAGIIKSNSTNLGPEGYDYIFGNGLADALNIANNSSSGQFAFTSAGFSMSEGGGSAVIAVSRTGGSSGAAAVEYATGNGSAIAGNDYISASGTLSFGSGETVKTFNVPINEDIDYEGDETVYITLSNPSGGALGGQSKALIIITENEAALFGQMAFGSATYSVGEGGGGAVITVNRTGGSDGEVAVNYVTSNGSATAGSDYTAARGTFIFGKGEITKTFTVPILEDSVDEASETVNLSLSSPGGGATLGGQSTAVITITDNDASAGGGGGGGSTLQPEGESLDYDGGTIKESGVTVTVPVGALVLDEEIRVQVEEVASTSGLTLPKSSQLVSRVVEIVKDKSGNFEKPVTITMTFDKSKVDPDQYTVSIYWYDESSGKWVELENVSVDMATGMVSGAVNHFTKFAVIAVKKPVAIPSLPPVLREEVTLKDISGHWAEANIKSLIATGAVSGYPDGTFRPDGKITRAEFAAILVKAFQLQAQGGKVFKDTAGQWARDFISTAAALGIVNGYPEGNFGPDDLITREQMAVMTVKAAKLTGTSRELTFADTEDISDWALEAVAIATGRGIMKGYPDSTVNPRGYSTRAEAVTVILNALNSK